MNKIIVMDAAEFATLVRDTVQEAVSGALRVLSSQTPSQMNEIQAAEYLGVQPSTLRGWRVDKRGPVYHKSGRSVRYSRADLDDWLKNNKVLTIDALEGHHGTSC